MGELLTASDEDIERAAQALRHGRLVAFPTETVYGLGANALDARAVARVFEVKERPAFDPLIVHLAEKAHVQRIAHVDPDDRVTHALMDHFWPGPLTLVLPKNDVIPSLVTSGLDTVAVRVPSHTVAQHLIATARIPIAAPSANKFGALSPTHADHVVAGLGGAIDIVIDGGASAVGLESTIVSVVDGHVSVLRLGGLSVEEIGEHIGTDVEVVDVHSEETPNAPGQLKQHYSPNTPMTVIRRGDPYGAIDDRAVYIAFNAAPGRADELAVRLLSPTGDMHEAAANLFDVLHQVDAMGASRIIAELMPDRGLGRAINDRLKRASARFE